MKQKKTLKKPPIEHWSYSSLMALMRNPLTWYKRYVENVRDMPSGPASFIGRAGHTALEHFYKGASKEEATERGLVYMRDIPDFEIDFGSAKSKLAQRKKRKSMEAEYLKAVGFYLKRAPRYNVVGVEAVGLAEVEGLALPIKAISDLVVESKEDKNALDIVDHKFVASFSKLGANKTLFVMQAIFNYYTVSQLYEKPVKRFIIQECKRSKNKNGSSQMRKHIIHFDECREEFVLFHRLINDATAEITRPRIYLPNPSDMFEGENSFDIYRLGLVDEE
ncbi:PD-(D/E)XK nuclease family protein [Candidatus Kaiserbacteria bacterium]|nr:PD-(D/E)XK nuclease family protein [Candidatus Kaiserbacteria bacterium]